MKETVNNIRKIRKRRGLTQEELASECDTHKNIISRLETGKIGLSLTWMETLSKVLKVNKWELVDDTYRAPSYVDVSRVFFSTGSNEIKKGAKIPPPIEAETDEGLWAYKMIDNSMEQLIPRGSIMLAADPNIHDLPIEIGSVVFFRYKDEVMVRQYIVTEGEAYLAACPMHFDPSIRGFSLDRNKRGRKSQENVVNIRDIFAVLWWVYQDHIASLV